MSQDLELVEEINKKNIEHVNSLDVSFDKASTSRFSFYLKLSCVFTFVLVFAFILYGKRFQKPQVKINSSSLYTPVYK